MRDDASDEHESRDNLLRLLNDDEIAAVTIAEGRARVPPGEQYLDLDHLEQGVRWATEDDSSSGEVLPRKAIPEALWNRLVRQLVLLNHKKPDPGWR